MATYEGTVYSDAINTGVAAGVILAPQNCDFVVTTAGVVISNLNFAGTVFININARVIT